MAEKSTFIKLDRNITRWGWYQDPNVFRIFVHLLINANIDTNSFLGVDIERGCVATSYGSLASDLSLSYKQVRDAISKLERTEEVKITRYKKFLKIEVLKYKYYQDQKTNFEQKSLKKIKKNADKGQSLGNSLSLKNQGISLPY